MLNRPSDYIERYGWVQYQGGNREIGYCTEGAFVAWINEAPNYNERTRRETAYRCVRDEFCRRTKVGPVTFNDQSGMTKEVLLDMLKQAEQAVFDGA